MFSLSQNLNGTGQVCTDFETPESGQFYNRSKIESGGSGSRARGGWKFQKGRPGFSGSDTFHVLLPLTA